MIEVANRVPLNTNWWATEISPWYAMVSRRACQRATSRSNHDSPAAISSCVSVPTVMLLHKCSKVECQRSVSAAPQEHGWYRGGQDLEVLPQRPPRDVLQVHAHPVFERNLRASPH